MQQLTPAGQNVVDDLARRYNLSQNAVMEMLVAVNQGGGFMAQFWCGELGGGGQWMRGGMTMVGDMFNHGLKNTVDNLCNDLSNALANTQMFPVAPPGSRNSSQWWPGDLGSPFSSGGQNNIRYAVFPRRLAVELNGQVTVYDTLDHNIGGVSQQQGGDTSLSFGSQYGTVSVSSLPIVSGPGLIQSAQAPQNNFANPAPAMAPEPQSSWNPPPQPSFDPPPSNPQRSGNASSSDELIGLIEKLARLRDAGALTDQEFNTKKSELLGRL
ncbi:SHOCT domain-containing protein [uncultured Nevskia sp.]|uniref:SHOCT domain-containing protein n=1 Tax=uncultured Nevskia sp. TaxID=228950 RepID=UPI0025CBF96F|nr:SHOCT domain-containing protein [uncultured Nevskia sp.]